MLLNQREKCDVSKEIGPMASDQVAQMARLLVNPAASVAAFASLSLGFSSQTLGIWTGMATGAFQASQRLFSPSGQSPEQPSWPAEGQRNASSPRLTLVEGGATGRASRAVEGTAATEVATGQSGARKSPAEDGAKIIRNAANSAAALGDPEMGKEFARQPEARPVSETHNKKLKPAPGPRADAARPEASKSVSAPKGDKRRPPEAAKRPEAPDDLKAISGIGPKLEKVLNGLGIWTYAQLAGLAAGEIAWLEDHLGFGGRIGRDDWLGQATALASAKQ